MIKIERLKTDAKKVNWVKMLVGMAFFLIMVSIFIYILREGLLTFTLGR